MGGMATSQGAMKGGVSGVDERVFVEVAFPLNCSRIFHPPATCDLFSSAW
jgi:hypothetical protein